MTSLDDLDAEQQAAARAVRGPVCIVAGAGTGKTRTVTHRIAHAVASGEVDPRTALAITHSRKAANELADRVRGLGVAEADCRTFHAAGLRVASQFWSRTGRPGAGPRVASGRDTWGMWRDAIRGATRLEPDTAAVRDVIEEVGWARSRIVTPAGYPAAAAVADRHPGVSLPVVVDAWTRYTGSMAGAGLVDFADLLEIATDLLVTHDDVAAQVRRRWTYVTVDEYQDTDPAQQALLEAILGEGDDVCVVGDPRQAIYSWKGADPGYLSGFGRRYPSARIFELTRNYRSTPQILDWANRVASGGATRPLVATRPAGVKPTVVACPDEGSEARTVVAMAVDAVAAGVPASEIAILYRFNATQARFEAALARADISTVVADDTTFFDRPEVSTALRSFERVAAGDPEGPGLALLGSVLSQSGFDRTAAPAGQGAARARWESQMALLELVEADAETAAAGATALSAAIEQLRARSNGPSVSGITLATLHRAKGLEWDVVFVVGAADGAIPASYATTPEAEAEEERLFHVGVTRARRRLHVTWAARSARGWTNRPSRYLELFPGQSPSVQPIPKKGAGRPRPAGRRGAARAGSTWRPGAGNAAGRGTGAGGRGGAPARAKPPVTFDIGSRSADDCPHCTEPLKGVSAKRLGICADCVPKAPGPTGQRARALGDLLGLAAAALDRSPDHLVSPAGLLRLLDRRPATADAVAATAGVNLPEHWAGQAAEVLTTT